MSTCAIFDVNCSAELAVRTSIGRVPFWHCPWRKLIGVHIFIYCSMLKIELAAASAGLTDHVHK